MVALGGRARLGTKDQSSLDHVVDLANQGDRAGQVNLHFGLFLGAGYFLT